MQHEDPVEVERRAEAIAHVAALPPSPAPRASSTSARIVLHDPLPVRDLEVRGGAQAHWSLRSGSAEPTLLVTYGTEGAQSRQMLSTITTANASLVERGLRIVALCGDPPPLTPEARRFVRELDAPFLVGVADRATWGRLLVLKRAIYRGSPGEFVFPTSFLLDADGAIRIMYPGGTAAQGGTRNGPGKDPGRIPP